MLLSSSEHNRYHHHYYGVTALGDHTSILQDILPVISIRCSLPPPLTPIVHRSSSIVSRNLFLVLPCLRWPKGLSSNVFLAGSSSCILITWTTHLSVLTLLTLLIHIIKVTTHYGHCCMTCNNIFGHRISITNHYMYLLVCQMY